VLGLAMPLFFGVVVFTPSTAGYSASVVASGRCPACRGELPPGRKACSGRCRAFLSRQRQAEARQARDRQLRALLRAALNLLEKGGSDWTLGRSSLSYSD
jgi:predicted nucleic acid-binding Zn ribbon protein